MTRTICTSEHVVSPADLIGHLNLMHPERLQVIGTPDSSQPLSTSGTMGQSSATMIAGGWAL